MEFDLFINKAPLHIAAELGNIDILTILLKNKYININVLNSKNQTPLHYAAMFNKIEIIEILLENSALKNIKDKNGYYPYMLTTNPKCRVLLFFKN